MKEQLLNFFKKNTTYIINELFFMPDPEVKDVYLVWIDTQDKNTDFPKDLHKYMKESRLLYGHALIVYFKEDDFEEIDFCNSLNKYRRSDVLKHFIKTPLESVVSEIFKGRILEDVIVKVIIETITKDTEYLKKGEYVVFVKTKYYENTKNRMISNYPNLAFTHCWIGDQYEINKTDPYDVIVENDLKISRKFFLGPNRVKSFKDFLD